MNFSYADMSVLELKAIQSRTYNTSINQFLNGLKDSCTARGGQLTGFYGTEEALKKKLSLENFDSGNMICSNFNPENLIKIGYSNTQLRVQGQVIDQDKVQVRIIANSFTNIGADLVAKKFGPISDEKIYKFIFKDISDAIGVDGIPIKARQAE